MGMSMMGMTKGRQTDNVNDQAKSADSEQFSKFVDTVAFDQSLHCLVDDLDTYKPRV